MGESKGMGTSIGIDLGTTNSRVAVWLEKENRVEYIVNDHGNRSTPSFVAFTGTERLIGDSAKNQVWRNPINTIFDAKRLIGRTYTNSYFLNKSMPFLWPFRVVGGVSDKPMIYVEYRGKEKVFSPEEVCAMVLGKMKDLAEIYLGSVVISTCVSIPPCFNFTQREAVRNACSMAGFETYTLVTDHSCAALAYLDSRRMTRDREYGERSLIFFDLGGGTLDVTLITIEEGIIEVKATSGDSALGGEDFDLRLLNHCIEKIKLKYDKDVAGHPRAVMRLKKQVERVKLALSSSMEATIQIDSLLEGFDFEFSISRSCFEEMNMDLFRRCIDCVERCLRDVRMSKEDVQEVVLVGGSSRIPKVQQLLVDFFKNDAILNKAINPDEAVVCGAVIHRIYVRSRVERWNDFLVLDVTPHSYGLETSGGVMTLVIARNSTLPTKKELLFTTSADNQLGILFKVYEGERARTRDNVLVAIFELSGIPPASRGVPKIRVIFDIDIHNGLTVLAQDEHSGQKWEIFQKEKGFQGIDQKICSKFALPSFWGENIGESFTSKMSSSPPPEPPTYPFGYPGQYPTSQYPNEPFTSSAPPPHNPYEPFTSSVPPPHNPYEPFTSSVPPPHNPYEPFTSSVPPPHNPYEPYRPPTSGNPNEPCSSSMPPGYGDPYNPYETYETSSSSRPPASGTSTESSSSSRAYESSYTDESCSYEDTVKKYSWEQVQDMTNFLTSTQLGKGGFGFVYLGKSNGKKVAVKVLDESSQQGIPEFVNEVNLLRSVNHANLVRLLGYCQDIKKVLIYEFAEEGTLWDHLHGGRSRLDWKQRLNIALQSACGLEYLHTGCSPTIYHRDIKSENILLTRRMVAKVADFGISKVGSDQDNIRRTHVTTMIKGTLGYLDPEYLRTGQLTDKSDVYSFGVLLLEIITGRKPIQNSEKITSIIDWVNKQKGKSVADPFFEGNFNPKALKHVLNVAKQCTQASGADRPVMKKVVRMLETAQAIEADEKKSSWSWPSWT